MTQIAPFVDIFAPSIFPGFPFQPSGWSAVAFERDNYDNTRVPEDFFVVMSEEFRRAGEQVLFVKGIEAAAMPDAYLEIEFSWPAYRNAMLTRRNYSVEYRMVGAVQLCACWSDAELTVWGGESAVMRNVVERLGGQRTVEERMLRDFYLDENGTDNQELRRYLARLLENR